ncbi:MAG: hypothetical protein ACREP9_08665 [Candidatus Dormibacteraceae bacterium]
MVAYITGHGLKTAEVVAEAKQLDSRWVIEPNLRSFNERVLNGVQKVTA